MTLSSEWRGRIEGWQQTLATIFYRPLGHVKFHGMVTTEQLSPREALKANFIPFPEGTSWGAKWEYGWFKTRVRLPHEAVGRRIVLRADLGGESAVFVNGKAAGAFDKQHPEVTLAMAGKPDTTYNILIEAYAGHGPRVCSAGPCPPGVQTVPEPPAKQATVRKSTFGIWEEGAFQLWVDVDTLLKLRDNLDPNSLRVSEIDAVLRKYSVVCDLELPRHEMMETVRKARRILAPAFRCRNGSTVPLMYCFGHAHLDLAWLWPWQETERKACRTISTQLALIREYPGYRFLQSQAHLYWMVKNRYPELYRRIKAAVRTCNIIPEGGMWVEADTNITGGESLIRQFMHGKRFFSREFGVASRLLWLPDVFGYSGTMPQIMRGCGIHYFSTAKIFWNYHGGEPFPYNTFYWEGIDGSRVLAHFHNDYSSHTSPDNLIKRWKERVQKDGIRSRLFPFGYGDGGGGPTRLHLEYLRREVDLEGVPRSRIASPVEFFRAQEKKNANLPVYVGELYYQVHRGTYTSQSRTKRGNRKSEFALREAECWSSAAVLNGRMRYPAKELDRRWRQVLFNQFHDIIPGSSIHRVHEETERDYDEVINAVDEITRKAAGTLVRKQPGRLTVFNSLGWERPALVRLPSGFKGAQDTAGKHLPVQKTSNGVYAFVERVPSCGWITVRDGKPQITANRLKATIHSLENEQLKLAFNSQGEITGIMDKQAGRELAAGPCNALHMYNDVPARSDAWDIDSTYGEVPVALPEPAEIAVESSGPLFASLRITRKLNHSRLRQVVTIRSGSRRVDFATFVDWRENHKMLKVNFPVAMHADLALHEIQFGHLARPTHASRQFDADRFEVSAHKWTALCEQNGGCAILNDCKYGVNVRENSINLTLLRSPLAPDMTADKGRQEFTYSFYAWHGSFAESNHIREAYDLNIPVLALPGAAEECSLLSVNASNIVIETVKLAEDGSGDLIVRLYESKQMSSECILKTTLQVRSAVLTNLLEHEPQPVAVRNGTIRFSFRPFEIKTLRLTIRKS